MELVTPDLGLAVWTGIAFLILLVLLRAFAWGPILGAVEKREQSITDSLAAAEKAKEEMAQLQASNEELLKEAYEQRDALLKKAKETHDQIVSESKGRAKQEAEKIITSAREEIAAEKNAAMAELRGQVASLAIEVAEKVLREKLSNNEQHQQFVETLVEDVNLN